METETFNTRSLTSEIVEKIDSRIYTDAYQFCRVDNAQDPSEICSNDE